MKRLQISIEEELDEALATEAARQGTSKAALLRGFAWERLSPERNATDPMAGLIGDIDADAGDIDEVVYQP